MIKRILVKETLVESSLSCLVLGFGVCVVGAVGTSSSFLAVVFDSCFERDPGLAPTPDDPSECCCLCSSCVAALGLRKNSCGVFGVCIVGVAGSSAFFLSVALGSVRGVGFNSRLFPVGSPALLNESLRSPS